MELLKISNLKKVGLGIAIIIVFNLFVNYGISAFYERPEYNDFCKPEIMRKGVETKERCDGIGGLWTENMNYKTAIPPAPTMMEGIGGVKVPSEAVIGESAGWCDAYFTCQKDFEQVNNVYKRNLFIIWIVAGVLAIMASFFLFAVEIMSVTFMFAGIASFLIGTIVYWSAMQDYLRFIILGIALAVLIYVGYKKLKDNQ